MVKQETFCSRFQHLLGAERTWQVRLPPASVQNSVISSTLLLTSILFSRFTWTISVTSPFVICLRYRAQTSNPPTSIVCLAAPPPIPTLASISSLSLNVVSVHRMQIYTLGYHVSLPCMQAFYQALVFLFS